MVILALMVAGIQARNNKGLKAVAVLMSTLPLQELLHEMAMWKRENTGIKNFHKQALAR